MTDAKQISVLIVEHSTVVRELLTALVALEFGADAVGLANDGRQAIRFVEEHDASLVLLDMETPDINGMTLLERMKRKLPNCRFIVLTNYPFAELKRRCTELGAEYCFDKGTEFERALEVCRETHRCPPRWMNQPLRGRDPL